MCVYICEYIYIYTNICIWTHIYGLTHIHMHTHRDSSSPSGKAAGQWAPESCRQSSAKRFKRCETSSSFTLMIHVSSCVALM